MIDKMTVKDLEVLFDYGYWANKHILEVLAQLSAGQFTQPVAGSYGSVRDTMVHMLSAEWGWLDRCGGPRRGAALVASNYPTVASVVECWQQVEGYVREFLLALRDKDLDRAVEFAIGGVQSRPCAWENYCITPRTTASTIEVRLRCSSAVSATLQGTLTC